MKRTKHAIAAGVAALLVTGGAFWFASADADSPAPPEHPMVSGADAVDAASGDDVPFEHREAVSGFVRAYYSASADDASPLAWVERIRPWATAAAVEQIAGDRRGGGAAWEEFVLNESRFGVEELRIATVPDREEESPMYVAEFVWTTSATSTTSRQEMSKLVELEEVEGRWLVFAFEDLSTGTKVIDEVAPLDSPDEEAFAY